MIEIPPLNEETAYMLIAELKTAASRIMSAAKWVSDERGTTLRVAAETVVDVAYDIQSAYFAERPQT